jgi:hypothetical protein
MAVLNLQRRRAYSTLAKQVTMATADDLDGTLDGSQYVKLTGRQRLLIAQVDNGTPGTAGIDVVEISYDGTNWIVDPTLINVTGADRGGTYVTGAALNAAGTEPTGAALFKSGPHKGHVQVRLARKTTSTNGTTWVSGAPSVYGVVIG